MTTPRISFEFFPPKTDELEHSLQMVAKQLAVYEPHFVSVTYGAGGSTRERTHQLVTHLQACGLPVAPHLTCVGASRAETDGIASRYWNQGLTKIVALRGDPPEMNGRYQPHPDGYAFATDLVAGLRKVAGFHISVAAYPETHPEAASADADLDNLKRKMDAGASQAISQFFLDTDMFLRFRERAKKAGITMPLIPGLLPVGYFERIRDFATKCNASIPAHAAEHFSACPDTPEARKNAAVTFAVGQIERLRDEGIEDFHFYTLNRADLMVPLCDYLRNSYKFTKNPSAQQFRHPQPEPDELEFSVADGPYP